MPSKAVVPYEDSEKKLAVACYLASGTPTRARRLLQDLGVERLPDRGMFAAWLRDGIEPDEYDMRIAEMAQNALHKDRLEQTIDKASAAIDAKLENPEKEKLFNITGLWMAAAKEFREWVNPHKQLNVNMPGATFKVSGSVKEGWDEPVVEGSAKLIDDSRKR